MSTRVAVSTRVGQSSGTGNSSRETTDLVLVGLVSSSLELLNSEGRGLDVVLALEITVAGRARVSITSGWVLCTERVLFRFSLQTDGF